MKWFRAILLSLFSGLVFAFAWYPHGLPFLIFFAWIPLFLISDTFLAEKRKHPFLKGWLYSWPGFLIWNLITTYWIGYCTLEGAIGAIVANSLLQSWVFGLWHCCRTHIKREWMHPILLTAFWMSFEYLHLNWDLTWPWLNLGNVFATCPHWVQWYSITGAFGGTLWIFVLNFLFFYILRKQRQTGQRAWGFASAFFIALIVPILISAIQFKHNQNAIEKEKPVNVVVVQQNTDPWEEEYELDNREHIERLVQVSRPYIDVQTDLVVCPESSVPLGILLHNLKYNDYVSGSPSAEGFRMLDSVISIYPKLSFILGLSTYDYYDHAATPTATNVGPNLYFDSFNTAACYNAKRYNGHYHKSRLVPGVEKMPFPKLFGFLENAIIKLGGSNRSLGVDSCQRTFTIQVDGKPMKIGTAICYESIYGELFGNFIQNGAELMTVITNDSWWKDSQGHKQHFEMSRLRAIETHRYVVRSANGGFSGIISPTGDVLQKTKYNSRTALKATVYAQEGQTFYVKHGDYIAKIAILISALGFLYVLILWLGSLFIKKHP